ncbi:MAG: MerR family transcriptional regulator [Clostridia bacterium]
MAIHDPSDPVYTISVMARLVGSTPAALRMWEREGLVRPHRTGSNNRLYSDNDYYRLVHIQELTRQGVNLAGVRMILEIEQIPAERMPKVGEKTWQRS